MKKIISFVGLFAVFGAGIGDAHGVAMSAQVRRLLQEKQEKIEQLEKCEGKKQGWMIAGISTIGLTAVGVGVNIAQASKKNRLSDEIEMEKSTLERHQDELNRINRDISDLQAKKAEEEREKRNGERRDYPPVDCSGLNWTGAIVGEKCGLGDAGVWAIKDDGDTDCLNSLDCQKYKCKCVIDLGLGGTGEWTPHAPILDNPDGKIGETCGDNGEGKWTEKADGTKKCSNANGLVACECVKQTVTTPGGGHATERKIGGACVEDDMKRLNVSSGHYIRNENTRLGTRCEPGNVLCACFADTCEDGYELVYSNGKNQGWCRKTSGVGAVSSTSAGKGSTSTTKSGGTSSATAGNGGTSSDSNNGGKGEGVSQVVNPVKSANGGKKDGKKSKEQCVKTHGQYLSADCVCESGTGLIPVLDDAEGKKYCGCGMSDTWNGTKCVSSNTAFKPKGNYTVSYGGETWNGIGACSSVPGGNAGNVVNEQSKVQRAYDNYKVTDDNGENCYCKIIDPKKSSWVFSYRFDNLAECVKSCVVRCQGHISSDYPEFQKNVFDTIM